jgi:flagellar assembly factor FliW
MSAATLALPRELTFQSHLFGTLTIPRNEILTFPDGLPGFEEFHRFTLLATSATGLYWLQSIEEQALAFLVVEARRIAPTAWPEHPTALAIVTLPAGPGAASANLQAPLLVDTDRALGRQMIAPDSSWGTTHPFDLASLVPAPQH